MTLFYQILPFFLLLVQQGLADPTVTLSSTTDYIFTDDAYNLTCTVTDLADFTEGDFTIVYQFSENRLKPNFETFAEYRPIANPKTWKMAPKSKEVTAKPTLPPTQYEFVSIGYPPFSTEAIPDGPVYPEFPVILQATANSAAGVYRCAIQNTTNTVEKYISTPWEASYDFASSENPGIPQVTVTREISQIAKQTFFKCKVSVNPKNDYIVGFELKDTTLGQYRVSHGAPATISWISSSPSKEANLFPQKVTEYPTFPVLIQSSRNLEYLRDNLQCYVQLSLLDQPSVNAIYYSNSAFNPASCLSVIIGLITAITVAGKVLV